MLVPGRRVGAFLDEELREIEMTPIRKTPSCLPRLIVASDWLAMIIF